MAIFLAVKSPLTKAKQRTYMKQLEKLYSMFSNNLILTQKQNNTLQLLLGYFVKNRQNK